MNPHRHAPLVKPESRPRTRLFVVEALSQGVDLALGEDASHYLRHVLRMGPGDEVLLFNGRDGEYRAVIAATGKGGCRVKVGSIERPQGEAPPDLWLVFAPIKRDAIDRMVEKATELGVTRLCPVITAHTDVARVNTERLRALAIEAAEQCERLDVPVVTEPMTLGAMMDGWTLDRVLLVCAEAGPARALRDVAPGVRGRKLAVLTGPEGGFSTPELVDLAGRSFVFPVGLGPRILKADTAALAALACVQALAGDWAEPAQDDDTAIDQRPPWRTLP